MYDRNLIKLINKGRCVVLVGSGPSIEIGYPSWCKLAADTYEALALKGRVSDKRSYQQYLANKKYPELFKLAQRDLGNDHTALVELIKSLLYPQEVTRGLIYEHLSKWPFACYLTTNFDDELQKAIERTGRAFPVIRNRLEDFYLWRDGVKDLIQKLHSDLDHPHEVVLTSSDYTRLYVDKAGAYYRTRLASILTTYDILIIGHSLTDPDLAYILRLAKEIAAPQHPIYMIGADFTKADEKEFLEQYNIVLIRYKSVDGTHSRLQHIFKGMDRFIAPRDRRIAPCTNEARPEEEVQAAVAISLYRRLQGVHVTEYLSPLILTALYSVDQTDMCINSIGSHPILKHFSEAGNKHDRVVKLCIANMVKEGLLAEYEDKVVITLLGRTKIEEYRAIQQSENEQAYNDFRLTLKKNNRDISDHELTLCHASAKEVIVTTFAHRGMVIAKNIYSGHPARPDELTDVFGYIVDRARDIEDQNSRSAFVEAMHQFILEPSLKQRAYLSSVSQGYFLYHLLGLDPKCGEVRAEIFRRTLWLCDSNVLLPLVAIGCYNHAYAKDLFSGLAHNEALLFTTEKLLQEVWDHLQWASRFIRNNSRQSLEFLRAASVRGTYKQNLFLDGFIRLSAEGSIGTFEDYLMLVCPTGGTDRTAFDRSVVETGIDVITITDLSGFVQNDWGDVEHAQSEIQRVRVEAQTYRSQLQVESEAEILVILRKLREGKYIVEGLANASHFYFISHSRSIDRVFRDEPITTWSPEALYRYQSALSKRSMDPDLLQECMLHGYYYAGVSFIDKKRYEQFFGSSIDQAKISYERERDAYVAELEKVYVKDVDDAFNATPDIEKPFFSVQMAWKLTRSSREKEKVANEGRIKAEVQVRTLESERDEAWRIRKKRTKDQDAAELRNLQNPKHVRKRRKQAKRRKRK